MRGREIFKRYAWLINACTTVLKCFPLGVRRFLWRWFSDFGGTYGVAARYIILKSIARECGSNVAISKNVHLLNVEKISIGSNVSIHPMCYIDAYGGLNIGNDVSIAHGVTIMTTTHNYQNESVPIKDQGISVEGVTISDDVWLGAKSTILSGVHIGRRSIVAASALVKKDVPAKVIVAGIPAKIVKEI